MRGVILACLAAGALAAPPAHASHTGFQGRCSLHHFDQAYLFGNGGETIVFGVAVATDAAGVPMPYDVSIRCEWRVDGVTLDETRTGTGTGVAETAGRMGFYYDRERRNEVCAYVTVDGEAHEQCRVLEPYQVPPQEVIDRLYEAYETVDGVLCPVLGGDVYVVGEWVWDCPPYGS